MFLLLIDLVEVPNPNAGAEKRTQLFASLLYAFGAGTLSAPLTAIL